MPRDYSPVDSDADIDQTPVRRFRLRKDGVARATSPLSPTQSPGPDNLDRAMQQFQSSFNTTPLGSRMSASSAQNNAPIASPTPQRHGSVSSS
ncbi:1115_t:CDS:1, partial [Acaulospora colombiana]